LKFFCPRSHLNRRLQRGRAAEWRSIAPLPRSGRGVGGEGCGRRVRVRELFVVLLCAAPLQESWSDQIDPASIARILGTESSPHADAQDRDTNTKMLDGIAKLHTRLLDQGNPDWNASHPKWKLIFDHIRDDFEADMPAIITATKAAAPRIEHDYEIEIASQLSKADVDAILAYYNSPPGKRYEALMQRLDRVMNSGGASLFTGDAPASSQPTPEQMQRYLRLLQLSHLFRSMMAVSEIDKAAHRDASGTAAISFMAAAAARKNQAELETLSAEYADEISAFEVFEQTDASKHLYRAMGMAIPKLATKANPIAEAINAVAQKHQNEWRALYRAQTSQ
jgi:hypothetical protein